MRTAEKTKHDPQASVFFAFSNVYQLLFSSQQGATGIGSPKQYRTVQLVSFDTVKRGDYSSVVTSAL